MSYLRSNLDDSNLNCLIDGAALTSIRKVISNPPPQTHDAHKTQANVQAPNQSSQIAATAPPTSSSSASIQAKEKADNVYIDGTVCNFNEDIIQTNPVKQWFLSLRKGCDLVLHGNICAFDVDDPKGGIHSVILYGKVIKQKIIVSSFHVKVFL